MSNKEVVCPLCNSKMRYEKHNNTYIWVCEECPNIMFEYYEDENIKDLAEFIENGNKAK